MRNSAEYLPPAMAMARSREPAELLRVAEAWRGIDPGGLGLSRADWEAAGALLDSGQVPLLGAGTGAGLRFDFPDGTRVLLDQRFFVRSGDRCTCGGQRCLHRSAALRSLMENRFRRSWRMMPDLLGPDPDSAATPTAPGRPAPAVVTGLVFSEEAASPPADGPSLVLRPCRRTRAGTWRRSLEWEAIGEGMARLPPAQQNVLRTLDRWRRSLRPGVPLDVLGPELWTLVDAARAAGLEIGADGDLALREQRLGLDLRLERDPGGLVLRGIPTLGEGTAPSRWTLLGTPPHSALFEHPDGTVLQRLGEEPEIISLVRSGEVWIPEAELGDFSRRSLPRLLALPNVRLAGPLDGADGADGPEPSGRDMVRILAEEPQIRWELSVPEDPDWLDLHGTVTVVGRSITLATLIVALRSGQRFLLADGLHLDLDTPRMRALRRLLETAAAHADEDRLRLSRHDLTTWDEIAALEGIHADADRWRTLLHGIRPVDLSAEELDPAVHATMRPYQLEGYRWLSARWDAGLGGILADDMGLGKTLQLLAAIRRHRRRDDRPVLVVAPRSVLGAWAEQASRFVPDLRVDVVTGRLDADPDPAAADVVVVSHQLLRLDSARYRSITWAALVLDEAQAAKNPASQLHRALREQRREVTFAVTGTPVENSLQDLWALAALVAPGLLPPLAQFTRKWRRPIERGADGERLALLRRRIAPILLRRTKDLVARDLPPKLETTLRVPLAPAHITRYTRALNTERQRVLGLLDDPEANRVEILAALTRLRLLATDPGTVRSPSAKVRELVDRLEDLAGAGHRALVFSQFTSHLRTLREILRHRGITTAFLDGSTASRERVIDDFRTGAQPAFLLSLKAGGTGLTLVEADYVFLLDPWWNPAVEEQAIDRTHRIGQDSSVTVYRLVSAQTIEEKVVALQEAKRTLVSSVLHPDGEVTTALDAAQIRELLAPESSHEPA